MDHHEKLAWSAQHLHVLDLEIKDFLKQHPFTARGQHQRDPLRWDIIANHSRPLPGHWPLMFGDALHNMRGALDHIVWRLSQRHSPPPTEDHALKLQYPICTTPGRYFGPAKDKGKGGQRYRCARFVGPRALARIDGTQPHLRGDRAHEHPLAILARYSNQDKHRNLSATGVLAEKIRFNFRSVDPVRFRITSYGFEGTEGRLHSDAHLGVLEFGAGTTGYPHMQVVAILTGAVAFGEEGMGPLLTVAMLEEILEAIHVDIIVPLDEILCGSGVGE